MNTPEEQKFYIACKSFLENKGWKMPDIPIKPDMLTDHICGRCKHYQLTDIDGPGSQFAGWFGCHNLKVNPDKKDPKTGPLKYHQKPCQEWEW